MKRNVIEQYIRIDVVSLAVLDSIDLGCTIELVEELSEKILPRHGLKAHLITRINVPREYRQQGYGRAMLKAACVAADEAGITLFIEALPYADSLMDTEALTSWYERAGFAVHGGILRRLPVKGE
jgi:GNAT superfamily N-acetyltransferase